MKKGKLFVILALVFSMLLSANMGLVAPSQVYADDIEKCESKHETALPLGGVLSSGDYYLIDDTVLEDVLRIEAGANVIVCLNGHILKSFDEKNPAFIVEKGATLTIVSCDNKSFHNVQKQAGLIYCPLFASEGFYGGAITGSSNAIVAMDSTEINPNQINVSDVTFMCNSGKEAGSCILGGEYTQVQVSNCVFRFNNTNNAEKERMIKGGLISNMKGKVSIKDCVFYRNDCVTNQLWGSLVATHELYIDNASVDKNSLQADAVIGGLFCADEAYVNGLECRYNTGSYSNSCQGAVLFVGKKLKMDVTDIIENEFQLLCNKPSEDSYFAGMICSTDSSEISIHNTTISKNTATGINFGSVALCLYSGELDTVSVSGNQAVFLEQYGIASKIIVAGVYCNRDLYIGGNIQINSNDAIVKSNSTPSNLLFYDAEGHLVQIKTAPIDSASNIFITPTFDNSASRKLVFEAVPEKKSQFNLQSDIDGITISTETSGNRYMAPSESTPSESTPSEDTPESRPDNHSKTESESTGGAESNHESGSQSGSESEWNRGDEGENNKDIKAYLVAYRWQRVYSDGRTEVLAGQNGAELNLSDVVLGNYYRVDVYSDGGIVRNETQVVLPQVVSTPSIVNGFTFAVNTKGFVQLGITVTYCWFESNDLIPRTPLGYVCKGEALHDVEDGTYVCVAYIMQGSEVYTVKSAWVEYHTYKAKFSTNINGAALSGVSYLINNISPGSTIVMPENYESFEGYEFAGWSTKKTGLVEYHPGDSVKITSDVTFYALWCVTSPEASEENHNNNLGPVVEKKDADSIDVYLIRAEITNFVAKGWVYGQKSVLPTAESNVDGLYYLYSSSIKGEFTSTVPTAPGQYYVKACISETSEHTATQSVRSFVIKPAQYDMSQISFPNTIVATDGEPVSLTISGTLPVGADGVPLTVSYSLSELTEPGVYKVVASFKGSPNYETPDDMVAFLEIRQKTIQTVDTNGNTLCTVSFNNGIFSGLSVTVDMSSSQERDADLVLKLQDLADSDEEIGDIYDVTLYYNGEEVQPSEVEDGMLITVRFKIPEELLGKTIRIAHVHSEDDISYIVAGEEAGIGTYVIEDGYLVTVINKLSEFAFMYRVTAKCHVHYYLILESVLLIAFIVLCIVAKKANRNALSIGGLLAFGGVTFAVSFFARCELCTILLIADSIVIALALIIFISRAPKPKDKPKTDEINYDAK